MAKRDPNKKKVNSADIHGKQLPNYKKLWKGPRDDTLLTMFLDGGWTDSTGKFHNSTEKDFREMLGTTAPRRHLDYLFNNSQNHNYEPHPDRPSRAGLPISNGDLSAIEMMTSPIAIANKGHLVEHMGKILARPVEEVTAILYQIAYNKKGFFPGPKLDWDQLCMKVHSLREGFYGKVYKKEIGIKE